jgi:RNA polymerase sigma-70 factor, ECF subfamily
MGAEVAYAEDRFRDPRPSHAAPSKRSRFEAALSRNHRQLRRLVAAVIADPDRVDDVLQEAYVRAYRKLPAAFANEAHEATWLYRVAYRCALDELRRRRRNREDASEHVQIAAAFDPADRLALDVAFRSLEDRDRAVLVLVAVIGLDYATAARVLEVPEGTLGWRVSVARKRFREALGAE